MIRFVIIFVFAVLMALPNGNASTATFAPEGVKEDVNSFAQEYDPGKRKSGACRRAERNYGHLRHGVSGNRKNGHRSKRGR